MLVYTDNLKSTLPAAGNQMIFDGTRVWVSLSDKTMCVYMFWRNDSGTIVVNADSWSIDLSLYLTGQGKYLAIGYNRLYVFDVTGENVTGFVEIDTSNKFVDIIAIDDVNDTFTVAGDQLYTFTPNSSIEIIGSTDGAIDRLYTIQSRVYDDINNITIVTVVEDIVSTPVAFGTAFQTFSVVRTVSLPQDAHCIPIYANNRLWFVTKAPDITAPDCNDTSSNPAQSLFYYDLTTNTWSGYTTIPGKRQYEPRKLAWAGDYFIFVTGYNESCVYKFGSTTGNYVSQIITNRQPKHLQGNNARQLRVKGASGMLSTVDQIADTSSNDYTIPDQDWFFEDDTYIWTGSPVTRFQYASGSDNIRIMGTELKDYTIDEIDGLDTFDQIITTPSYSGSFTLGLVGSTLYSLSNLTDSRTLWHKLERDHFGFIYGTAMIGIGPDNYYGETE